MSQFAAELRRICLGGCERVMPLDWYPLARPRADGSRHPMRFCSDCLRRRCQPGALTEEEKRDVRRYAHRTSKPRRRRQRGHW